MKHETASEILNGDNWSAHACAGCDVRFENSISSRPGHGEGEVDLLCRDCAYQYDARDLKLTGVMSGTSLATAAYLRRDLSTFRMFFETEVSLTPTMQAAWARYKDHPAINHPSLKRALLVDTATGELHERTWGEKFAPDAVQAGVFTIEIFDSLCGYYGITLCRWRQPEPVMYLEGQARERSGDAWYRSCYADRAFIDAASAAARAHLGAPVHGHASWEAAEDDIRRQLVESCNLPEFKERPR